MGGCFIYTLNFVPLFVPPEFCAAFEREAGWLSAVFVQWTEAQLLFCALIAGPGSVHLHSIQFPFRMRTSCFCSDADRFLPLRAGAGCGGWLRRRDSAIGQFQLSAKARHSKQLRNKQARSNFTLSGAGDTRIRRASDRLCLVNRIDHCAGVPSKSALSP